MNATLMIKALPVIVLMIATPLQGIAKDNAESQRAQDYFPENKEEAVPKKEYSPYVDDHFPTSVFFGDTHLHTSWSADAGLAGASLGPEEAYRISRGEAVKSHSGLRVKLNRPLDFIVVADHAENLGLADFIDRSDPILLANPTGKRWHDMVKAGTGYDAFLE